MKILAEEIVVRYHVEFDEEETTLLRAIGWVPPHGEPCARLWSTKAEITEWNAVLAQARKPVS